MGTQQHFDKDSEMRGALSVAFSHSLDLISYRTERWKLISYFDKFQTYPTKLEMFDLKEDPAETHNLIENSHDDIAELLLKRILIFRKIRIVKHKIKSMLKFQREL